MWIGSHLGERCAERLKWFPPFHLSYRWLNALTGSFHSIGCGIAYQLSHRRSYAFIAALFAAADGLFLW